MSALREANPTDGLGREINGEYTPAISAARSLPTFTLWWAEYQEKMRDLRLASLGCKVARSPNHPISRFKKAVRVMNDRNEVVQHQRRLRPIAPERRSARNCARRSNATVLDRCRTGGLCGLAAADLPSERSDDVRRRLQHQSESGRGDPPGANGFARVLCPPPRTVPGGGIFAGNSNGRRLRRDCARSGGASLLLPQRTQRAQRNRWINLCLLRGSLCPLWFIFARWCITRLPKHRIFSSIS